MPSFGELVATIFDQEQESLVEKAEAERKKREALRRQRDAASLTISQLVFGEEQLDENLTKTIEEVQKAPGYARFPHPSEVKK